MTDSAPSIDAFLSEIQASLTQSGGEAVLRRINAERLLHLLAEEFVEDHQAERVRILPDRRLAGEAGADFLLQIDDYDIRLQFLDAPEGKPVLDADRISEFADLLTDNPSTVALILVWTTDNLLAVSLSMSQTRQLAQNPQRFVDLLADARPLPEVLRTVVERQTRFWEVGLDQTPHTAARSTDMRRLFEEAIGAAIDAERQRSYRYTERKLAARTFPAEEERLIIFSALAEALAGRSASELVSQLIRVSPRRGGQ